MNTSLADPLAKQVRFENDTMWVDPNHFSARYEPEGKKGVSTVMKKRIPKFKNEDEERAFWAKHDSTKYVDWSKAKRTVFLEPHPER